jgi:hypothetical protein
VCAQKERDSHRKTELTMSSCLYSRFTRKLLLAIVDRWDSDVHIIDKVAPSNWKLEIVIVLKVLNLQLPLCPLFFYYFYL